MLIERSNILHGSLLPAAYAVLSSLPEEFCYHQTLGRRHPKSAYATSLRLLSEQWLKFLEELERLRFDYMWRQSAERFPLVLSEYRTLLHRIHEHLDACYSVLRSLCEPTDAKASKFDVQFLEGAKLPGWKDFQEITKKYNEEHIGLIVNSLKHSQAELCSIYFSSNDEFYPGYYLRDVLPDGSLGPSWRLHDEGNTAFSFARDVLVHLWNLYKIGDQLAKTITIVMRIKHNYCLVPTVIPSNDVNWPEVLKKCAALRPEFFRDEWKKPYPLLRYNPRDQQIAIEFPNTARGLRPSKGARRHVGLTADMAHPLNKMPYWRGR